MPQLASTQWALAKFYLRTATDFLSKSISIMDKLGLYLCIFQAAARYKCDYLVDHQRAEFISSGGDKDWLKGLSHAPPKLKAMSAINKILGHTPWRIDAGHIKVSPHPRAGVFMYWLYDLQQVYIQFFKFRGLKVNSSHTLMLQSVRKGIQL